MDTLPQIYVNVNSMQRIDAQEILEDYRNYFQWSEGERILDIGSGSGDVTSTLLAPRLPNDSMVIGCDISEEMVKFANANHRNDRLAFIVFDIQQKYVRSSLLQLESFHKIFSFYCLHWINDYRQTMQNIYYLLRPGGDALLMFLTPDHPIYIALEKIRLSQKWKRHLKKLKWFYESNDHPLFFERILLEVGFEKVQCYLKKTIYRFPSWDHLREYLIAMNPYLRSVPEELRQEYINDLDDMLEQQSGIEIDNINGEVILKYDLLVAAAKKGEGLLSLEERFPK